MVKIPKALAVANLYQVSGDGIHVTYSTSGLVGEPQLTYQDAQGSKTFMGSQIKVEKTEVGTLVSVVLHMTVDAGSTTFTLVIPTTNLTFAEHAEVNTFGVVTVHKFSIIGPPHGQTELYTVHQLHGTAAFVLT
jgi:hypothetical protein